MAGQFVMAFLRKKSEALSTRRLRKSIYMHSMHHFLSKRGFRKVLSIVIFAMFCFFHLVYFRSIDDRASQTIPEDIYSLPTTTKKFILFRSIGNDLPPRHERGQSYTNLKFILENERHFPDMDVRWLVNRILDEKTERKIIKLLKKHKQHFLVDRVNLTEYSAIPMNLDRKDELDILHLRSLPYAGYGGFYLDEVHHDRNLYIMNNNGARNKMLFAGKASGAQYILPWDGNCFLTENAWDAIVKGVERVEKEWKTKKCLSYKYFSVPMARMKNNTALLDANYKKEAKEEPQLIFHTDAKEIFDPTKRYGRIPKVDLLQRIGVPGWWDGKWFPQAELSNDVPCKRSVQSVGWVARLFSGKAKLEYSTSKAKRANARTSGVWNALATADSLVAKRLHKFSNQTLLFYDKKGLEEHKSEFRQDPNSAAFAVVKHLIYLGEAELSRKAVYSVVQDEKDEQGKQQLEVESLEDVQDFFAFSERCGLDEETLRRDWERSAPNLDRIAMTDFARNTTILALTSFMTDDLKYAKKASKLFKQWFVDEDTRMNPHMQSAGIKFQNRSEEGTSAAFLDTVDLGYLLDAFRIIDDMGAVDASERREVMRWFKEFSQYLEKSSQGSSGFRNPGYIGTYYDLQLGSIYAFLNDVKRLTVLVQQSAGRIFNQFDRSKEKEYSACSEIHTFNSWGRLVTLGRKMGIMLHETSRKKENMPLLQRAVDVRLKPLIRKLSEYGGGESASLGHEVGPYLYWLYKTIYSDFEVPGLDAPTAHYLKASPVLHRVFRVPPFWNLGLVEVKR